MRKFVPYVLCGVMAVAFSLAVGESGEAKKSPPIKHPAKKQQVKPEDKAERPAAAGGSVKKEDIDDDGKNKKEKD
jgi:hypothetical protein